MEKLIEILKRQLQDHHLTDIIQVGARELSIVVDTDEVVKNFRRMEELIHDDSEIKIKGIKINFVNQYGIRFENL